MDNMRKGLHLRRAFLRYEPDIEEGVAFLFNKENGEMLEGNYYAYLIAKTIQEEKNMDNLAKKIAEINEVSCEDVWRDIKNVVDFLYKEGFIYYDE